LVGHGQLSALSYQLKIIKFALGMRNLLAIRIEMVKSCLEWHGKERALQARVLAGEDLRGAQAPLLHGVSAHL